MDFLLGFIFGYLCKEIISYLKRLADSPLNNDWDNQWDWMSPIQEDDLP
tara:strand:+ start:982 stop:1128 length:147 start_codon:yes stop_codon:yes gene_type:complete